MASKPSVLVLGGVGMVGRNVVTFLVEKNLASAVRVADKRMSFMSYFSPKAEAAFSNSIVEELQLDLSTDKGVEKAFAREGDAAWDIVINCCAETSYGNADAVYAEKTVDSAAKSGVKAKATGVSKYIYVSSGAVYASQSKTPAKEDASLKPWNTPARFNLEAEQALSKIAGLPLIIVRPSLIYGSGDTAGLMPFFATAAVYAHTSDKLELLWDKHLCRNCVHIDDVVTAIWLLVNKGKTGDVYNLSDPNNTRQGYLCELAESIFGIKTGYVGKILSNLARVKMTSVVDAANHNHLMPWLDLCKACGINNTPLTPVMHKELLAHSHMNVDGSAITKLGFTYKHAKVTANNLKPVLAEYARMKLLPVTDSVLPKLKKKLDSEAAAGVGAGAGSTGTGSGAGSA